jgi:hypothetical protein
MTETNDTSRLAKLTLEDTELGAVTGGLGFAPFAFQVNAVCRATMDYWIIYTNENGGAYLGPYRCPA